MISSVGIPARSGGISETARSPKSKAIPSSWRRRATKASACSDSVSIHWASSTMQRVLADPEQCAGVLVEDSAGGVRVDAGIVDVLYGPYEGVPRFVRKVGSE